MDKKTIITLSITGVLILIAIISVIVSMQSSKVVQQQSETLYWTRYTGCNSGMTVQQIKQTGHGVYFSSQQNCLTYTDPVGYLSIVG